MRVARDVSREKCLAGAVIVALEAREDVTAGGARLFFVFCIKFDHNSSV